MKKILMNICLCGFMFGALPQMPVLTGELAAKIAQESVRQCKNDGYAVSVTVVDNRGEILAVARSEESAPHTIQASFKKAYTATSMKNSTANIAQNIAEGKAPEGLAKLNDNFVFLGGGLPIKFDDIVVGGVGVGGAPGGHLDEKCAQVGIDSIQMFLGE